MKNEGEFSIEQEMPKMGARLKVARQSLKMSQQEFATTMGISQSRIAQCELGKMLIPTELLVELYRKAKKDPLWILMGIDLRPAKEGVVTNLTNFEIEVDRALLQMHTLQMKEMLRRVKELEIEVKLLKNE